MKAPKEKHFIGDIAQKALIEEGGRVLLVKDKIGFWGLPGGRLNVGETPEAGLKREVDEELGVEIAVGFILDVFPFVSRSGMNHFAVIYQCKITKRPAKIWSYDKKIHGVKWFHENELKNIKMRDENRRIFEKYFSRSRQSRS